MFETSKTTQPFSIEKASDAARIRVLTPQERVDLNVDVPGDGKKETAERYPLAIKTTWQNPETGVEQAIEIDIERNLVEQSALYKRMFNLDINEAEVKAIWGKHFTEIKVEMETYGYDTIVIIPDTLPEESVLNSDGIERMEGTIGNKKQKVNTFQGENFKQGGSFASVRNTYVGGYRIILTHSVQNISEHPILKQTVGKNIPDMTGLSEKEIARRIGNGEVLPVSCKIAVNGQEVDVQAEGMSLEEYEVMQLMFFEKTGKHLDEREWTWLPKSLSGSRVVCAGWGPGVRRLGVGAVDPSGRGAGLGLRLSRSFSK